MNWLSNFMEGRYGIDQLSWALLILGMLLTVLGKIFHAPWLTVLSYLPFLLCVFRFFSRNGNRRRMENNRFFHLWFPVKQWFCRLRHRMQDEKLYRFYRCPQCKVLVKVPKNRGKIKIKCPKCSVEFIKKT